MKTIANSFFLFLSTLALSLFIIEMFCRLILDNGMHYHLEMWKYAVSLKRVSENPKLGHVHLPNKKVTLMGVDIEINQFGLRSGNVDLDSQELKILMLGDSITFGWGVSYSETVSSRLEYALESSLEKEVKVVNAGVGNYNTAMQVEWLERVGLDMNPDIIILNFFINDAELTPTYNKVSFSDQFFYSKVIFLAGLDTAKRYLHGGQNWREYYTSLYSSNSLEWREFQKSFLRLVEICIKNRLPLIIVDYPELRQLSPYPFKNISEKIKNLSIKNNLPYIPLLPALVNENPKDLWVTVPDPHPNGYANELMAEFLFKKIISMDLLSPGN